MAVTPKAELNRYVNQERRDELAKIAREVNILAGIPEDLPAMTVEELQQYQRAHGVRAEENIGSRELLRMRYGEDYQQE